MSHVFMIVPIMVELGELRPGGPAQYAEFVLFAGSLEPLQIDLYGGLKFALFTRARDVQVLLKISVTRNSEVRLGRKVKNSQARTGHQRYEKKKKLELARWPAKALT